MNGDQTVQFRAEISPFLDLHARDFAARFRAWLDKEDEESGYALIAHQMCNRVN